jgi:hypothetical protein
VEAHEKRRVLAGGGACGGRAGLEAVWV